MIQSLHITDFQNHSNSLMEFCSGVNVIRGESDQGKSAIVRAFLWLVTNRPQGFSFRRRGVAKQDLTSVSVETDEGIIERIRDEKEYNQYSIILGEDAPLQLKALRTDVPEEVRDFLQMSALNVQSQHDPYFLLRLSPGDVAREFNKVVGLDIIDSAMTRITSVATSTKSKLTSEQERIAELETELGKYELVDIWREEAAGLVTLQNEYTTLLKENSAITKIVENIIRLRAVVQRADEVLHHEEIAANIAVDASAVSDDTKVFQDLRRSTDLLRQAQGVLARIGYDAVAAEEEMVAIKSSFREMQEMEKTSSALYDRTQRIISLRNECDTIQKRIDNSSREYADTLAAEQVCPTCFRSLDSSTLNQVKRGL